MNPLGAWKFLAVIALSYKSVFRIFQISCFKKEKKNCLKKNFLIQIKFDFSVKPNILSKYFLLKISKIILNSKVR